VGPNEKPAPPNDGSAALSKLNALGEALGAAAAEPEAAAAAARMADVLAASFDFSNVGFESAAAPAGGFSATALSPAPAVVRVSVGAPKLNPAVAGGRASNPLLKSNALVVVDAGAPKEGTTGEALLPA
jgi:hypothetical protein